MTWMREPDDEPIPGYRLVEPLGTGGFGEVWKCIAPGGLFKAIKFVYGNLNTMDGDSEKATQEYKALERIKLVRHTFVLSMDRIEIVGGELLIVMELADQSLHDCFMQHVQAGLPGIPRETLLRYLADAAEGLDYLNEKNNLQHLDVKPKNLFLIGDHVKVADFGLVKHLERQSAAGLMGGVTPVYAAPETFSNKISKHSDQYSLAVLYTEMLTGQRPFNGRNIRQLALQHMTEEPDLSMLPPSDRAAVRRALAKNPEDRFPNCVGFIRELCGQNGALGLVRPPLSLADISQNTPPPVQPALKDAEPINTATLSRLELGVLRPSILIGVGSFGRRALHHIRCRLLDRIGDLQQAPSFRFVYIDVEPSARDRLQAVTSEAALEPEHLLMLPLQPPTAYRRKQLDQILEWLPREKLYAIPRSLSAGNCRALGRLAFCDHYLRVVSRLKHEVHAATHPESMKQTADQTGLAVRDMRPSVYVFASVTGGSGGMLLDLGHAIRRVLEKHNTLDASIQAFLYCGAPADAATSSIEQANTYAAIAELNHYADPDVTFTARYGGPDGPKIEGSGLPFTATYLLPITSRSASAYRDCLAHLSSYIVQELTTPLGSGLEEHRRRTSAMARTPFRSFGTFGVWFPRGLLLRAAARQCCASLLRSWIAETTNGEAGSRLVEAILCDPRLQPAEIQELINDRANRGSDGPPRQAVTAWIDSALEQASLAARQDEPASWAVRLWDQAREVVGQEPTSITDSPYRRGRFSRSLDSGIMNAVAAWSNEITELLRPLESLPGQRLAELDSALRQLASGFMARARKLEQELLQLRTASLDAQHAAMVALNSSLEGTGTFRLFGGRSTRSMQALVARIRRYVESRCYEDMVFATMAVYQRLSDALHQRLQCMAFAREQLSKLIGELESAGKAVAARDAQDEGMNTAMQITNTVRVVLPNGDTDLERAAGELLTRLGPQDFVTLQEVIDRLVLDPRGGLEAAATGTHDLRRSLAPPIIEQIIAFLRDRIPSDDVAQIELSRPESVTGDTAKRIQEYVRRAQPIIEGPAEDERTFVLVPATPAGTRYAQQVRQQLPKAVIVMLQTDDADLMFCREQAPLRVTDLLRLIEPCAEAYEQEASNPEQSPHSRMDVTEWMPLAAT